MKKGRIILIAIAFLFILMRLLLVSSQRDDIFDYNEFVSGTIAIELISGLSLPFKYYLPDDHNYGSVVNGILIVPFYRVFGPSAASAKMVPILFSLGVLIFWYLLLNRFFNRRVAVIAGLLLIFSPTIYTKNSVLSIGSHPESNLFTAAIVFISYYIFFAKRNKNIYYMTLGLVCGFAFFYSYLCGVTLLVLLIFWMACDNKFILRPKFHLFALSAVIGYSPGIYYAFAFKSEPPFARLTGFFANAFNFKEISLPGVLSKANDYLMIDLPRLFNFSYVPDLLGYSYYFFFLVCVLLLLWIRRRSIRGLLVPVGLKKGGPLAKESLFLLFIFIFFIVYVLSAYTVWGGWQNAGYIVPLYPFIFAITAIGAERLTRSRYWFARGLSIALTGFIILAGVYENMALISFTNIGRGFTYKGYSYRMLGERMGATNFCIDSIARKIKKIDFIRRKFFLQGVGWGISRAYQSDNAMVSRAEEFIKKFSFGMEDRLYLFKGLGRGIAHHMALRMYYKADIFGPEENNMDSYLFVLENIASSDEEARKYFWEGFGQGADFPQADKIIGGYVEERFKPYFYQGLGQNICRGNQDDTGFNFIKEFDPKYAGYIISGYKERQTELLMEYGG